QLDVVQRRFVRQCRLKFHSIVRNSATPRIDGAIAHDNPQPRGQRATAIVGSDAAAPKSVRQKQVGKNVVGQVLGGKTSSAIKPDQIKNESFIPVLKNFPRHATAVGGLGTLIWRQARRGACCCQIEVTTVELLDKFDRPIHRWRWAQMLVKNGKDS